MSFPLLSLLVFLPAVGAAVIPFFSRRREGLIKGWALGVALMDLVLAGVVFFLFKPEVGAMQFVERAPWIPQVGVSYFVGVDGISLLLVGLTAFLSAVALAASWNAMGARAKEYTAFLLLLEAGVMGAFVALDLVLFFVFWEAMLIPMYLLIGVCGGPRRIYAALKFFLYTTAGSLVMLVGILVLYFLHYQQTNEYTFDLLALTRTPVPGDAQLWLFLAFALAFAIKVPIFPFHTWLPDAYTQAPIAAMAFATMLVKVGAYGFLRFNLPLFPGPSAELAPLLSALAVIGILYGGWVAVAQRDIVRLLAYSSIAHLGFVVLGLFALNPQGLQGSILQMVNHGLSVGALFILAAMLYERAGSVLIADLGGLAARWPRLTAFFLVALFSYIGLPGLNGFVGELLVLLGAFRARPAYAVVAALGIILAAIYMLWMFQRAMHGPLKVEVGPRDLSRREAAALVPLIVFIVWIGLYPAPFLGRMEASVNQLLAQVKVEQRVSQAPGGELALLPISQFGAHE